MEVVCPRQRKSQYPSLEVRPLWLGEMRPLREPEGCMAAGFLTTQREVFNIGNAIDPDRPGTKQLPRTHGKVPWRGTRGDHDVGTLFENNSQDAGGKADQAELVPAVGIFDDMKTRGRSVVAIGVIGRFGL